MKTTKTIASAVIEISAPQPVIENGEVVFQEATDSYQLNNFEVPKNLDTDKEIKEYLADLLHQSDCFISCVERVTL